MKNYITLEKNILLDNIKDLINISVDENVSYLKRSEGVQINGEIQINGIYENNNGIEKFFHDFISINNIVPYEHIDTLDDFNLTVEDFEYSLVDDTLNMYIRLKLNSFKELENSFPTEDNEKEILIEIEEPQKDERKEMFKTEKEPFLSNLLNTKNYQKASTFFVYKADVSLEDICKKFNVTMDTLKKNNKEEFKEGDLINIPLYYE